MDVSIDAISFNHDPDSDTDDALTIRKNETEVIVAPEWKAVANGPPETSAVAYARSQGNNLTIAVQLRRLNPQVRSVQVSATSGSILGNLVRQEPIVFSGNELSRFELLDLIGARIDSAVVSKSEIEFEWTLRSTLDNGTESISTERTRHLVYTLLDVPKPPWGPHDDPRDFELPWTEVLDIACDWAAGAGNQTEVASRITRELHNLGVDGKLQYPRPGPFSHLSLSGTDRFNLTEFLADLNSPSIRFVNCDDCAILVTSFANILGCDLYQSRMGPRFFTNQIRLIGPGEAGSTEFNYHEVAWEHPCDSQAKLFDCCLEVDGDLDPSGGDFQALLPINILFGNRTNYHFRLVRMGFRCVALPGTKTRRRIARERFSALPLDPVLEQTLKDEFGFSDWEQLPSPGRLFTQPIQSMTEGFIPDGWKVGPIKVLEARRDNMTLSETIWPSTISDDLVLRVLSYKCASVSAAHTFLLNLLGSFQLPVIKRRLCFETDSGGVKIGDLAFSGPEDRVLLFARSNLVVFVQNAGRDSISVAGFSHSTDRRILRMLEVDEPDECVPVPQSESDKQSLQSE